MLHDADALLLARFQFGFTVSFHFIFPAFSIGLASYLAVLEALWLKTGKALYLDLFKYWLRIFAVVFAISLFVVAVFVRAAARYEIDEELRLATTLFVRQLDARSQQLVGATRLLSGDFALKTAVATADHETTRSVLENHRRRIGADLLMIVSLDGAITADTREPADRSAAFALPRLLEEAEQKCRSRLLQADEKEERRRQRRFHVRAAF